jgi:hypothetical protein
MQDCEADEAIKLPMLTDLIQLLEGTLYLLIYIYPLNHNPPSLVSQGTWPRQSKVYVVLKP